MLTFTLLYAILDRIFFLLAGVLQTNFETLGKFFLIMIVIGILAGIFAGIGFKLAGLNLFLFIALQYICNNASAVSSVLAIVFAIIIALKIKKKIVEKHCTRSTSKLKIVLIYLI